MTDLAFWMTNPHFAHIEIARDLGFTAAVFDVEHGSFGLDDLDRAIGFCHGIGIRVYAKVLGPQVEAVQQALDFGADGAIIPHVGGVEEARRVCAAAKYPPLGTRSLSGGRPAGYKRTGGTYAAEQNAKIRCWPMIETAEALADVEEIAALPTVDGLFVGPTDLSYTRGRGPYVFGDADKADIARVAAAAKSSGKGFVFPAWTPPEREFGRAHGASLFVVGAQFGVIRAGFDQLLAGLRAEGEIK